MKIKIFYIAGVEGSGHHALTPAIHASLTHNMNRPGSRIEINERSIVLLNRACCELWYRNHDSESSRRLARNGIKTIMQHLEQYAAACNKTQILILDNSFPSAGFRTTENQWDLSELADITCTYADIHFLGLYREPIATTFSHQEWDGGLRGHAMIISVFLEYLQNKLASLERFNLRFVHYEDLVNRTRELAGPLARYLGVEPADVGAGLGNIRKSAKSWERDMPEEDRRWIRLFFSEDRISRWPVFLDRSRNLLP
jgi:hypothetical protein